MSREPTAPNAADTTRDAAAPDAPDATVAADVPADRPIETLDVRDLGPPEPLRRTLELLADLPAETVLVQRNDRTPQFLFPKLADRGYVHDTAETDDAVVTAIWKDGGEDGEAGEVDEEGRSDGKGLIEGADR
ncbi:DUF2249 domain-containing protein [Halorubrum trueperi]|uniref:DUF2249 domain-containing protein n=1 Tax=Halorubrum trueperi TaxID=2004704 RepID=A0ABD5UK24_9EURY